MEFLSFNLKQSFLFASFFLLVASSCSKRAPTDKETQSPATEEAGEGPGQKVVQTPDYAASATPVKEQLGELLQEYLLVTEALVASDGAATRDRAESLLAAARQVPVNDLEDEQQQYARDKMTQVQESAEKMAGTADANAQREHLQPLSEAIFALTKAFGANDETIYYQYCPMAFDFAGAYWVSTNQEIRNPYFGDSMLKCGSNEEVLQ